MRNLIHAVFLTFPLLLSSSLSAQEHVPAATLNQSNRDALVEQAATLLRETYVFPDVAEEMANAIEQKNFQGEYKRIETLGELTQRLTDDLRTISHDKHLALMPANPPPPASGKGQDSDTHRQHRVTSVADNFGFRSLEILPGNIGYVDLRRFASAEEAGPTAIAAMNFLAHTAAIIFDLRNNGGGDPTMIQLISSYLFEERQHLNSFYIRRGDRTEQYWTQASVSGQKLTDLPVYILTSAYTFSAAEEFTYNLKSMKRATVVGETTGGGAHPVEMPVLALGDGLYARMSLPFGRAINPITNTNWEGTGITPDIEASANQAMEVAQLEILTKLSDAADNDKDKFALDWARDELKFNLHKEQIQHVKADDFAGEFGPRRIFVSDGRLHYQRSDGPQFELQPMASPDKFHVGELDNFRLQFVRDSNEKVIGLKGRYSDGRVEENHRTKP